MIVGLAILGLILGTYAVLRGHISKRRYLGLVTACSIIIFALLIVPELLMLAA